MQHTERIDDLRNALEPHRLSKRTIGLVPTMGALHAGHESLIQSACAQNDVVVVSIFVNPTQFGNADDLATYPRTLEADLAVCRKLGADFVFCPDQAVMYSGAEQTSVSVEPLGNDLIGAQRVGHFRGVATVVTKLFHIVQPNRAYFGRKDFQQLAIIRRMVSDLFVPVEIVGVETVRDMDGLALSSRNTRLSSQDREASAVLARALGHGARMIERGERSEAKVLAEIAAIIEAEPRARLMSLDIRKARYLEPVETQIDQTVVILVTAEFGGVLLIDQWEAEPPVAATNEGTHQ